jgi:hypothetical protein
MEGVGTWLWMLDMTKGSWDVQRLMQVREKVWMMAGRWVECLVVWQEAQESVEKRKKRKSDEPVNMAPIYTFSKPLRSVTSRHHELEEDKPR